MAKMNPTGFAALGLLMAISLAGCGNRGNNAVGVDPDRLTGVTWQLEAFGTMDGRETRPVGDRLYTLKIEQRLLDDPVGSGISDCNFYGGPLQFDEQKFRFLEIAHTEQLCPQPSQDSEFVNALSFARSYQIAAGKLRIFYNNGSGVLIFRPLSSENRGE